jgi:hypothetical protein
MLFPESLKLENAIPKGVEDLSIGVSCKIILSDYLTRGIINTPVSTLAKNPPEILSDDS